MMEVSASDPHRGLAQSRGVPSATVVFVSDATQDGSMTGTMTGTGTGIMASHIPERPGIVTLLVPTTESTTPCVKTLVTAKAAMRIADEYCILI